MRLAALIAAAIFSTAHASEPPRRAVSINLCTDQLALALAPERLASVYRLAADPTLSNVVDAARATPLNDGRAEEIVSFSPDLVLADEFTASKTAAFVEGLGVPVIRFGWVDSLAANEAAIRKMGDALGVPDRAEAMIAAMNARLEAVRARAASRERAPMVLYRANGMTAREGGLTDELLRLAGLDNLAATRAGGDGRMALELLVTLKPALVILDRQIETAASRAEALLDHPAMRAIEGLRVASIPSRLWICPGPWIADAAEALDRIAAAR